jgi:hypothetical protein
MLTKGQVLSTWANYDVQRSECKHQGTESSELLSRGTCTQSLFLSPLAGLGLPLGPHLQSIFLWLFLEVGVSGTIYPGWPLIVILLISASQVNRITGVSHLHLAQLSAEFGGVVASECNIAKNKYQWQNIHWAISMAVSASEWGKVPIQ